MSLTIEQEQAIKSRGNVLVSASAGAGKTSVMIKRLANILDGEADLSEVLAVTFTKKAASQMKDRLRSELITKLREASGQKRENIRAQMNKISTADISTIHSFCARLARTYFYALGINSDFEILADNAEEKLLKARAMDELFSELYLSRDDEFYLVLSKLRKRRSDETLKEVLLDAYDKVRIHAGYIDLLESYSNTFTEEGFDRVVREYEDLVKERCKPLVTYIEKFEGSFFPPKNREGYIKVLEEYRDTLKTFIGSGNIFEYPSKLATSKKPSVTIENAEADGQFVAFVDAIKKCFKRPFKDLENEEEEKRRFISCGALSQAFTRLLLKFDARYTAVKREENKLDYADLEHCCYALLSDKNCDCDVREKIRSTYKFVFVDEYQDVNPIQDEIITAVAGKDIFCVGDIKQAIYGFRGSRSDFFKKKGAEIGKSGEFIVLPDNFRSSSKVIEFVNCLFASIMMPPLTKFKYSDAHAMRGGARYQKGFTGSAEICLFDGDESDKQAADGVYSIALNSAVQRQISNEGKAVLKLIDEALKSTYYDPDDGCEKQVKLGDICVLVRKHANKSAQNVLHAITSRYPVAGAAGANICDRPEIKQILDVLSYLNNARQEIAMASTMLSPLGDFTEEELAKIREYALSFKEALIFSDGVKGYASKRHDYLSKKCAMFLDRCERLRTLAECIGAGRLIDEIMAVSDYAAVFDSENKLTALRTLQKEAYTPGGELTLSAFLSKLNRGGRKISAPPALAADCVKFMTMHASKGLEFPVVIVADIASDFKGDDKTEIHYGEFGFAPRYYDDENRSYGQTILRRLYKLNADKEELENEINLFYVACTRAKYALRVLCADGAKYDKINAIYAENYAALFDNSSLPKRKLSVDEQTEEKTFEEVKSEVDPDALEKLERARAFKYGYELGVELPVKSSASRLVSQNAENCEYLFDEQADGEEDGGLASETGTAYHRFLQLADFGVTDARGINEQLARWEIDGLITTMQRELLDIEKLIEILNIPAIKEAAGKKHFREREFICRLPSYDYLKLKDGEEGEFNAGVDDGNGVIVQGAIDLLCVEERDKKIVSAYITDYKYSVHGDEFLKKKYALQLALYKSVVCAIYKLKPQDVKVRLVNIRSCKAVDM